MSKDFCNLCSKHCNFGKEKCSCDEQDVQHNRLLDVLRGGGEK